MVAVPEPDVSVPVATTAPGRPPAPALHRRAVAVAVSAMELLRPESDLARLLESFDEVDLLLATEDLPTAGPGAVRPLVAPPAPDADHGTWPLGDEDVDDEDEDGGPDEVAAGAAALGLPDLQLHRLGLRAPLGPGAEHDVLAAMSELVGFDPEPGVYCLAPASSPDPSGAAVTWAAQRIAQVYGMPLLRYRCMELSVVGEDGDS